MPSSDKTSARRKRQAGSARGFEVLEPFHPAVRRWFQSSFDAPTRAQILGWPAISSGQSTLIFAPTGSGKTLTAFLWCIDRLMFAPTPPRARRCRVIYISPLKALAVDVERNLRAPIAGISNAASRENEPYRLPTVAVRTGDTPAGERARFLREPADILITTPESLYLMLTSNAREGLRSVDTIIIDEIHALVPNKRGAHLAISLERLERLCERPPQRVGLSATQRPLEEVARFLGGIIGGSRSARPASSSVGTRSARPAPSSGKSATAARRSKAKSKPSPDEAENEIHNEFEDGVGARFRPVTIVNTEERKQLSLRVEVPVEDMAKLSEPVEIPSGPASKGPVRRSIWPAVHPRLLELVRAHRSTLIFVNSRRLAERLAAALNELAGETIANAHHGSIARAQRLEIEDNLKSGRLPALVATSSLELGIDMGAIDLVIQIEAPPSIASGMQRIGRASHQVGTVSAGIIFPKFRSDLVACAAVTESLHAGRIEPIRYPRNPLDIVAQQVVAMVAMDDWNADDLFDAIRGAAPFAELSRTMFDGVLDMLSGLYPSDEFAELRPRITWDRLENTITARPGAKRVAILNGGTIPDRGLYSVFLLGAERGSARVGELDEEMVFESRVGETFLLGASTWRIEEITHDRVVVSPAPGLPGKMPFWKGDAAERTIEFGEEIGRLVRELRELKPGEAIRRLTRDHDLDRLAAQNLLQYLSDQAAATVAVPDDRNIVIERVVDELGDWRVCVLTPFGGRIHAPWAMAATAKIRRELGIEVETMWSDDGFIVRFPETDQPPAIDLVLPEAEETEALVVRQLGSSSLFAAKFREAAARALLLPRRRPGTRAPLWQQRKRAYDLLQVASRFGSFPMLLEAYREVLRDVFDVPALVQTIKRIRQRQIHVTTADTERPSPFAGSLLFRYVANFIYDGDAPLAERRAQALSIDQSQLRELMGEPELRELLDPDLLEQIETELQHLDDRHKAKNPDAIHDLLLRLGDLSREDVAARAVLRELDAALTELLRQRRIAEITVGGAKRLMAIEDASRYRDGLGVNLPPGVPERFLQPVGDPIGDLVLRYARTHGPFTSAELAERYAIPVDRVVAALERFVSRGRIVEGEFRPGGTQREWCDAEVLRSIRSRSLARLRREVEPAPQSAYGRLLTGWQGTVRKRRGLNGLLEIVEILQGTPIPASVLEREVLPARIDNFTPADLDTLSAAGEIVWVGLEPLGERDGRVALYLTDHLAVLHQSRGEIELSDRKREIVDFLRARGASFFDVIHEGIGGGFPSELVDAMWDLVWKGVVTNDTFHALRAFVRGRASRDRMAGGRNFRSRRSAPLSSQGRWSLVEQLIRTRPNATRQSAAIAQQLLARYGVVTREAPGAEGVQGGFSFVYPTFKALEESGKIRRGYFVAALGATQFGTAAAIDLLRANREEGTEPEVVTLAATDPANPYGAIIKWPGGAERQLTRSVGASVILVDGSLACYLGRGEKSIALFLPDDQADREPVGRAVARALAAFVGEGHRRAMLLSQADNAPIADSPIAPWLVETGFLPTSQGYQMRARVP
jgi:ATP-dependent Lhr-like helicase